MSSIPVLDGPTPKLLGTREPFRHRSGPSPAAGIGLGALAIEGRARRAAAT